MRNATEPPGSPSFHSTAPGGRAVCVPTRASSAKMVFEISCPNTPLEAIISGPPGSEGVERDHPFDRPPAHRAEADLVAGEHDAVHLRPVVALRLVDRALEGPDLAGLRGGAEEPAHPLALLAEERLHLRLGPLLLAKLAAAGLDLPLGGLELLLRPGRG